MDDNACANCPPLQTVDSVRLGAGAKYLRGASEAGQNRAALGPVAATGLRALRGPFRSDSTPRRILLYGLNFAPEPTGTGKYTAEMAHWLAKAGHDVRVVTTPPYYPDWRVQSGYSGWRYSSETCSGVRVDRAPLWVPKFPGGAKRVLHLASFAVSSLPLLMKNLAWRPHLIWTVAPALACAPGAALAARMVGAISWLHIQDFEVDAAFEMGLLRGRKMRAGASLAEQALLRSFDRVSSISRRMVAKLGQKGVCSNRTVFFPNWVDTETIQPMESASEYREQLGIAQDAFVALYSGTMGAKQGLEVLAEAAHRLAHHENIHFVFCGQGVGREALQAACAGLPRVHWLPLQPVDQLGTLLNTADVHLLPQQRVSADLVMPSKLAGMLASGRPVLATADPGTEVAAWVDGCGELVAPGDAAALASVLLRLSKEPAYCRSLGAQARERAVVHLSRDAVLQRFHSQMQSALAARGN